VGWLEARHKVTCQSAENKNILFKKKAKKQTYNMVYPPDLMASQCFKPPVI